MAVSRHIWHCGAGLPGDVLIADLRAYRYAPHFHDAWSIGAIEHGRCTFTVHGQAHAASEGDLVVIAPGQVHTGGTSAAPLTSRMAYIDAQWFDDHARALFADGARLPGPVITAPGLCAQWLAALTPDPIPDPARRERLSAALFGLLAAHAGAGDPALTDAPDVCALLRERMAADPSCAPDLEALAQAQGEIMGKAMQAPELANMLASFQTNAPQLGGEVDRVKAKSLDVSLTDVFETLQINLGCATRLAT
ncbi:hypothetical protein G6F57_014548 [Rhizopus arrhizus]|nr:hypothetical protein G6F57_014548 [Rhizopus arrhizus]